MRKAVRKGKENGGLCTDSIHWAVHQAQKARERKERGYEHVRKSKQ